MKFAHMADVHIGAWRDPKLKDLSIKAFMKAVAICIEEKMDFIIISGDLFNNALPGIDMLKIAVKELKRLKSQNISVYMVPGSHDYSPSGKTMIDVLEEAGLLYNVYKGSVADGMLRLRFHKDAKTGAMITGILGKRGTLEKHYYEKLDTQSLEEESGEKIFLFHSAITELMPSEFSQMDTTPLSYLPKGFLYYAGGHVHIVKEYNGKNHQNVVYPGPLFPASFSELEKLGNGGFYVFNDGHLIRQEINLMNVHCILIDANHKSPEEVMDKLHSETNKEFINTIVLIRVNGTLRSGKASDIDWKKIYDRLYSKGAYFVLRNTNKLISEEFEEIRIDAEEDVEEKLIREHLGQVKVKGMDTDTEYGLTKELIEALSSEKHEGEKVYEYDDRIRKMADKILDV